jgi:hypothetical protein
LKDLRWYRISGSNLNQISFSEKKGILELEEGTHTFVKRQTISLQNNFDLVLRV